jgi:predicted MFS family arabinose efflux permease
MSRADVRKAILPAAGLGTRFLPATLFDNASQAILPSIVDRPHLARANGRLFGAQVATNQLAGPPLGGVLFAATAATPLLADAASFLVAAVLVATIPGRFRSARPAPSDGDRAGLTLAESIGRDIGEGLGWLWRHQVLRTLALVMGAVNLLYEAAIAVLVLFAQDRLGLGDAGYGMLLTCFAVGSGIASLTAERLIARLGAGRALVLSLAVMGASQMALGLSSTAWLAGMTGVGVGFALITWNVIAVSLRQAIIPDHLLGRVNSAYRFLGSGAIPLGALAGGLLAERYGLRAPFVLGGLGTLAIAMAMLPLVHPAARARRAREAADRALAPT